MRPLKLIPTLGLLVVLLLIVCSPVSALTIMAGSDYLETGPGTFLDFDAYAAFYALPLPPIGLVNFIGDTTGPGLTDTIVQRLDDAVLPTEGSTDTIDIELVALSLRSVSPVDVGGTLFDLSIMLSSTPSTGEMTLTLDDETGVSGTFTSFFNVFFDVEMFFAGTDTLFTTLEGLPPLQMQGSGEWDSTPPPDSLIISGPMGDLDANLHTPPPPDHYDFWLAGGDNGGGLIIEEHPGVGVHVAHPAPVPEPTTMSLLGLGLAGLIARSRKRKMRSGL